MIVFWQQLNIQRRIISALVSRDIIAIYGRQGLGVGWVVAEPLSFAVPVLTLWYFVRAPFEHGTAIMPILWSGYMPILLFRHIGSSALHFIRGNSGLLYHRRITLLDIFVARCFLEILQNIIASLIVYIMFYSIGALPVPRDFPMLLVGYLFMAWWCVTVGLFVGALSERAAWVDKIWNTYAYTYMFYSGFFFLADWIPANLRTFALLQPSLQAYEMIRAGLLGGQIESHYSIGYTVLSLMLLTWLGLVALRAGRKHVVIN